MADRIVRALVTGASSGLGASFARQLADRGVHLVLVARDGDRLRRLASTLPVDVEVLAADLTDAAERLVVERRAASLDRPIDLLVNDAGAGRYGTVAQMPADDHTRLVELNVTALVRLTRAALPQLLERDTGGVIQVGSMTGYQPDPYAATYGATKAFVHSFTQALRVELSGTGVHVLLLVPGSTRTGFQRHAGLVGEQPLPERAQLDPDRVVAEALEAFARRRPVCVPGGLYRLAARGAQITPDTIAGRVSGLVHGRLAERS